MPGLPSLRSEDHEALVRITRTVSMPTAITLRRRFALDRLGTVELRHTNTGVMHGPDVTYAADFGRGRHTHTPGCDYCASAEYAGRERWQA